MGLGNAMGLGMLSKPITGEDAASGLDLGKAAVMPTPMTLSDKRMMGFAGNTMSMMRGGGMARFFGS